MGDSLAAPVNHSGLRDGDGRCAPNVGVRSKTHERARGGGQNCGPEWDERRERVRRLPSPSGEGRRDSRGLLAIFNGFSTEPPRVRTRCGFIAGEVCYRTPHDGTRRGRVIHESKSERKRAVSLSTGRQIDRLRDLLCECRSMIRKLRSAENAAARSRFPGV